MLEGEREVVMVVMWQKVYCRCVLGGVGDVLILIKVSGVWWEKLYCGVGMTGGGVVVIVVSGKRRGDTEVVLVVMRDGYVWKTVTEQS